MDCSQKIGATNLSHFLNILDKYKRYLILSIECPFAFNFGLNHFIILGKHLALLYL